MTPIFIKSTKGNIFALYHPPKENADIKRTILFIPPFAEELNKSRHMINRQARQFAQAGYGVLILDFYGTGDSEGCFNEATINIWQEDILNAISWLSKFSPTPPIFWAMRSGALITLSLLQKKPDLTDHIILWSPVNQGEKFITQFLRIKLGEAVIQKTSGQKVTMAGLWKRLKSGDNVEVGGYGLSSDLAQGVSKLSLENIIPPKTLSVGWLETSLHSPASLSPASQKTITAWQGHNIPVKAIAVNDISFWTLQEPEWANDYLKQTLSLLPN